MTMLKPNPTQLAVLRALQRFAAPIAMAELHDTANLATRAADTSLASIKAAVRALAAGRHVATLSRPGDPLLYSITQTGRELLANATGEPLRLRPPGPGVGHTYRGDFRQGTYDGADLRRPPARGDAAMAAYRLPSRGIG